VYAPREAGATRPPVGPRPVLVVLHGAYGNGALARALAAPALERLADRHGFVVAYPDAYADGWNDCRRQVPYAARRDGVDDVAFVRALVARLAATRGVDGGRAYALGFSNGGHLALRLALEAPAGVAGVAAVGAALPEADDALPGCDGARGATAVLLVNGTADRVNPYAGGEVRLPDGRRAGRVLSSRATAEYFASLAGHAAPPHADTLAAAWPRARATRLEWRGAGAPAVALLTVPGGGHLLPRRAALTPLLGDASEQLDAVEEAVRFFGLDAARASRAARVAGGGRPSRILR
jgi:polyhydroxybutyrate depolymerase